MNGYEQLRQQQHKIKSIYRNSTMTHNFHIHRHVRITDTSHSMTQLVLTIRPAYIKIVKKRNVVVYALVYIYTRSRLYT